MSLNKFNHFNYPSSLSILRQLVAPASFIDHVATMLKAVRFYFLLKKLYEKNPTFDSDEFTRKQLRDFLFKGYEEYHPRDKTPNHIALDCLCNQTLPQLLFPEVILKDKWGKWKDNFIQTYYTLKRKEDLENYLINLEKGQPFQVTFKKIEQDLDKLVEMGWLKKVGNSRYKKTDIEEFVELVQSSNGKFTGHHFIQRGRVIWQLSANELRQEVKSLISSRPLFSS